MTFKTCVPRLAFCLLVVALTGCKDDAPVQTVEWYKSHAGEREQMISECSKQGGDKLASANCINAKKADSEMTLEKRGGYRSRPPMDFKDK
jgi:hypothetical protein